MFTFFFTAKDYGLFLADEDVKKGVWLEPGRNLDYYILRNGVSFIFCLLSLICYLFNFISDAWSCTYRYINQTLKSFNSNDE